LPESEINQPEYNQDKENVGVTASQPAQGIYYGWWLVVISGFVMVISTVPLFHAMSVWAVALERQFGWTRAQLGFALTFTRIEGGLMGPVEGYLTDRVGTRRMVFIGLTILGLGFLFFGQVQNLWMFYMAYVLMAIGQGLGSWIPIMTMLNHWFSRRRSTAIAWANVGSRGGALLLVPAIAWSIDPDHDRFGWQVTASAIGVFVLVVAFPVSRLIRNKPQEYGLFPDNEPPDNQPAGTQARPGAGPSRGVASTDLTPRQALRTRAFWCIAFGHGFTSMVILAIMAHLGLMMEDKGFTLQDTAWVVIVYLSMAMLFQLLGGYLGDRIPKRFALFGFTSIQAGAVVLLASASSLSTFYLFAFIFGIGFGGRNPLTVAIRGDYFGRASFGKILGLSTVPMNLLLLVAAPLAGYMRDVQGSYTQAFYLLAALNMVGAVLFLMAKRPVLRPEGPMTVASGASD
jgi:sugar phosphate permease